MVLAVVYDGVMTHHIAQEPVLYIYNNRQTQFRRFLAVIGDHRVLDKQRWASISLAVVKSQQNEHVSESHHGCQPGISSVVTQDSDNYAN